MGFGDGSLNSTEMLINGVETIEVVPKSNRYGKEIVQTTISEQTMLKIVCVKANVVRKSLGPKGLCEFESRLGYKKKVLAILKDYLTLH